MALAMKQTIVAAAVRKILPDRMFDQRIWTMS
jgi:hypothetical protein